MNIRRLADRPPGAAEPNFPAQCQVMRFALFRRGDRSGGDAVDADAVGGKLERGGLRCAGERGFDAAIHLHAGVNTLHPRGGNVDHASLNAAFDHVASDMLNEQNGSAKIQMQQPVDVRRLHRRNVVEQRDARIVHQHVEPPQGPDGRFRQPFGFGFPLQIAVEHEELSSEPPADFGLDGFRRSVIVPMAERQVIAGFGHRIGDSAADPPAAAGHQRSFSLSRPVFFPCRSEGYHADFNVQTSSDFI